MALSKAAARDDVARLEVFPHHFHDAPAAGLGHAGVIGVHGGDRGGARQRETERLGQAHHGRGGSHGHAGARGARDALLDLGPGLLVDVAGAQLGPVLPGVAAAAERLPAPVAAQHRTRGHEHGGQIHGQRPHDQCRRGLVAAAHQHAAVGRIGAQQLLRLHGEQIAVQHGGGLLERLRQRDGGHLDGKAAGLPHAALDLLRAAAEMGVALIDLAPGVDDRDHRLAGVVLAAVAHLQGARAVTEGAQILGTVPAMAAQLFRGFSGHGGRQRRLDRAGRHSTVTYHQSGTQRRGWLRQDRLVDVG